jgi:hypothetical protein
MSIVGQNEPTFYLVFTKKKSQKSHPTAPKIATSNNRFPLEAVRVTQLQKNVKVLRVQ